MKRLLFASAFAVAGATVAVAEAAPDHLRPFGASGPLAPSFQGTTMDRPIVLVQASPTTRAPGADTSGAGSAGTDRPAANISASEFARRAAMTNMLERQAAELALERSKNERVRRYAEEMLTSHRQASAELQRIARGASVEQLEGLHAEIMQSLRSAPQQQFDEAYIAMQVQAHQRAIDLFETYAENGEDQQLQQWARQKLPTLQDHLKSAENITRVGFR